MNRDVSSSTSRATVCRSTLVISFLALNLVSVCFAQETLAVVNGTKITKTHLETYKAVRAGSAVDDQALLEELINQEIMAQEAKANGYAEQPEVAAAIENQYRGTLSNAYVKEVLRQQPVTDEELRDAYKKRIDELPKTDFKLSNLVTDDEHLAKTLIDEAKKGANFESFKGRTGLKPTSAQLNWMSPDAMPPNIAAAVKDLKKGGVISAPIKTPAGWHILIVDDTRPYTPPTFETVRDQIKPILENNRVIAHVKERREKAKITLTKP